MADITIPAADATRVGAAIRHAALVAVDDEFARQLTKVADLLDPPPPSLRDEMVQAIRREDGGDDHPDMVVLEYHFRAADAVLTVVRRHVEALPTSGYGTLRLDRDDVLRLLGGDP